MNTTIFGTHAYVKRLIEAGFTEAQAEAVAETQTQLIEDQLVTKSNLRKAELRLKLWGLAQATVILGDLTAIKFFG